MNSTQDCQCSIPCTSFFPPIFQMSHRTRLKQSISFLSISFQTHFIPFAFSLPSGLHLNHKLSRGIKACLKDFTQLWALRQDEILLWKTEQQRNYIMLDYLIWWFWIQKSLKVEEGNLSLWVHTHSGYTPAQLLSITLPRGRYWAPCSSAPQPSQSSRHSHQRWDRHWKHSSSSSSCWDAKYHSLIPAADSLGNRGDSTRQAPPGKGAATYIQVH